MHTDFSLSDFLPYALNQAAEAAALGFQAHYKAKYGMLRSEWRVVFHLGQYGPQTAKQICDHANTHKTKVSRAVAALEQKRFLGRETVIQDRRHETLALTKAGRVVFNDLHHAAKIYDARLVADISPQDQVVLRRCLAQLAR